MTQAENRPPKRGNSIFITCNSFEARCLGIPLGFSESYGFRHACIFRFEQNPGEEPQFETDRRHNFDELAGLLERRASEEVIPIFCNRQNVGDGIGQFSTLFSEHLKTGGCRAISIDITCFTKLYLYELLHFLSEEQQISTVQALYNQVQSYGNAKLTKGLSEIFFIPHFAGRFLPNRDTVLVVFLGFETERALGLWEHYEPFRTVAVLSNPPMRPNYLEFARDKNSFLLSRPSIIETTMSPYDPLEVSDKLESVYQKYCTDDGKEIYNVAVISLGTKPQALGIYLFWRRHKNVRITYAFPREYGSGYAVRQPGENFAFPLKFS